MPAHAWSINGNAASAHDLHEAQALERQSRKKRSATEYERQQQEGNARAVGAGIRKQMRQIGWRKIWVNVRPKMRSGGNGSRRCARFEVMTRQAVARPSRVGADGMSSFHFKWTGRGLGAQRGQGSHRFRAGEAQRHVQYILREMAREIADGGLVSNISQDPDVIASLFSAIEELEGHGRANANVYVSLVISMPHELTGAQRAELLTRICGIFARDDLPHVGILHAPDSRGDQRNNHAHVMLSLRPFRIEEDGSFALASGTCADLNDKSNIKAMRTEVAGLMNEAMIAAGHSRRFTALSNKDRGMTPLTKRQGKSTPGIKHHERREARIEQLREDEACHKERRAALARLRGELTAALSAPVVDRQAIIERVSKQAEAVQAPLTETAPIETVQVAAVVAKSQPVPPSPAQAEKRPAIGGAPDPTTRVPAPIQSVPLSEYELQSLLLQLKDSRWPLIIRERETVKIAPTEKPPLSALRNAEALPLVQYALQAEWALWMQQLTKRLSRPGALRQDPRGFVVIPEVFGADALTFLSLNRDDPDVASAVRKARAADKHRAEVELADEKREKIRGADLARTVAELVARICGPGRPGTASPEDRARIAPDIQALAPALAAGAVTLQRVGDDLQICGVVGALPPHLSRLAKDPLGWQALQMIAEKTAGMSRPSGTRPLLLPRPNQRSGGAPAIEAVPIVKDNRERS